MFFKDLEEAHNGALPKPLQYIYNVGISLSQHGGTLLGGDPDESISGATGKASLQGKWFFKYIAEPAINALFMDENHCFHSIELDEGKRAVSPWYDAKIVATLMKELKEKGQTK